MRDTQLGARKFVPGLGTKAVCTLTILAATEQAQTQAASYADLPWWQVFQDPQLQGLIRTALKQNYDVKTAAERINAARAQLGITRSNQLPQVQGSANATGGKEYNFQSKSNFLVLTATGEALPPILRSSTASARCTTPSSLWHRPGAASIKVWFSSISLLVGVGSKLHNLQRHRSHNEAT